MAVVMENGSDQTTGDTLRTKVVATIGPATADRDKIHALAELGVDVFRLNFAHGTHDAHARVIGWAREASDACGKPVAVLADLGGPKIRIGVLQAPVRLVERSTVVFAPESSTAGDELPTAYEELAQDVRPGDRILLADGIMELRVEAIDGTRVVARVIRGGVLESKKGMNLPGVAVSAPALTEKDLSDLAFALDAGVDYVGLSFVQRPGDVADLRGRLPKDVLIIAKIEKDTALANLEEILEVTDAVMVARGDLGVELPFEQVPMAQKRIIQLANLHGKPVITATQMLESMIELPRPTRAEASDVANAVFDGTDAVMLSGETAAGKYPLLAVDAMVRIAGETERGQDLAQGPRYDLPISRHLHVGATPTEHAIAVATAEAVRRLGAPAIVTFTRSGATARLISSYRPAVPIMGVTDSDRTYRQLALVWGVVPVLCRQEVTYENMLACAREELIQDGIARPGDRVVVTAGVPFHVAGTTNYLRVEQL